jgi:hypothetical protein
MISENAAVKVVTIFILQILIFFLLNCLFYSLVHHYMQTITELEILLMFQLKRRMFFDYF